MDDTLRAIFDDHIAVAMQRIYAMKQHAAEVFELDDTPALSRLRYNLQNAEDQLRNASSHIALIHMGVTQ